MELTSLFKYTYKTYIYMWSNSHRYLLKAYRSHTTKAVRKIPTLLSRMKGRKRGRMGRETVPWVGAVM